MKVILEVGDRVKQSEVYMKRTGEGQVMGVISEIEDSVHFGYRVIYYDGEEGLYSREELEYVEPPKSHAITIQDTAEEE